ncbi:dipeptidase PepV [Planococcus lenghuensis]|uniref:Dipeptidase PepV n=1 Tax=Planococcus lenghuensis TaxID=2213202 RepID=A0A1Q2KX64_9BACL|nr:dipeptidase PepV [Planococcus lenghuensis]AQQ52769.1 dipeptidase PepV [Planococcus lenghuensis]
MDWQKEAEKRKDHMISELKELLSIPSVLADPAEDAPFGKDVKQALDWFLEKGRSNGYHTKNTGNKAGHLETGEGDELVGILGHVDIVPAGTGWTKPPFAGTEEDGRLYGRGAIDDKGPTIAAWTALQMVKESGAEFDKRVRLIIGTDEESGFRCMDRYFETEEMPGTGFAPDADFPIINAEKGIAGLVFSQLRLKRPDRLISFRSGERTNMVPDEAVAVLKGTADEFRESFGHFCEAEGITGEVAETDDIVTLTAHGKSAHAMEPDDGKNAGLILAAYLNGKLTDDGQRFVGFLTDSFYGDSRGRALGFNYTDEASGDVTLNPGVIRYQRGSIGTVEVSFRYSVTFPFDQRIHSFVPAEFALDIKSNSLPHHVDENDPFIRTLQRVYEKQTGKTAELLAIGGGTYARVLDKGVAFGMLFPGEADVAHQPDEFVDIENLVKATAIYAEAIYELACKK